MFRLKTRPTSHYVDLSQLIECLLRHASNHQVMRGFRHERRNFSLNLFHSFLVVGSTKWFQNKNSSKPTVEALKMSYDQDISSVEAINKVNELAQAKLNAGILALSLQSSGYWTYDIQDFIPLLFSMREAPRRPVQVVRLNDPASAANVWPLSIQEPFYPPLGASGINTSMPKKTQATSNIVPLGKNKKSSFIQFD